MVSVLILFAAILLCVEVVHGTRSPFASVVPEWKYLTGNTVQSSPCVVGGTVYIGSNDANVYQLDAVTGKQLWSYPTGGQVQSSPTMVDGTVYIGSNDGSVHALDASQGNRL